MPYPALGDRVREELAKKKKKKERFNLLISAVFILGGQLLSLVSTVRPGYLVTLYLRSGHVI